MVGDAACVIDPASGQGVHTAMLSGIKASQAILDSSNNNQHNFSLYEEWFHSYFEAKCQELAAYYKQLGLYALLST